MRGDEVWRKYEALVHAFVQPIPPRERHRYASKLLGMAEHLVTTRLGPRVWEEFRDARYRAGYHK